MNNDMNTTENKTLNGTVIETKEKKTKKIRNELLFKKGGVSLAITALFIAGVIVFNILFGILSDRFVLEYDFSKDKVNSLSSDNVKYVKGIDSPVEIIVCSAEDDYVGNLNMYLGMQGVSSSAEDYYTQTLKLIKKYAAYNRKIDLKFVDPNSSQFNGIEEKYGDKLSAIGDVIVKSDATGSERVKVLTFTDIYGFGQSEDGMSYEVTDNKIETVLTSAISYVVNNNDKKIFMLMGHSTEDYTTSYYQQMLKDNNYEVETNTDKILKSIPEGCSEIVIPVPSVDFSDDEILLMSEFLDNDGKLGKGLTVFASANAPYLPKLYDFLEEWGITIEEGKVFETDSGQHPENEPMTIFSYDEEMTKACVSASNVPIVPSENTNGCTVTAIMQTADSTVAVPKDAADDFSDTAGLTKKTYATVITSEKSPKVVSVGEETQNSYVSVFSSFHFLQSQYNDYQAVSNKDIVLSVTENNCGGEDNDIKFVEKTITNESFEDPVKESTANWMRYVFVYIIPLLIIGFAIFVYERRRNAK